MKINSAKFRVALNPKLHLDKLPTKIQPLYKSKSEYKSLLAARTAEIVDLQKLLYAHDRYVLTIIFQTMGGAALLG